MGEEEEAAAVEGGGKVPTATAMAGGVGWMAEPVHAYGAGGRSNRAHGGPDRAVGGPLCLPMRREVERSRNEMK